MKKAKIYKNGEWVDIIGNDEVIVTVIATGIDDNKDEYSENNDYDTKPRMETLDDDGDIDIPPFLRNKDEY